MSAFAHRRHSLTDDQPTRNAARSDVARPARERGAVLITVSVCLVFLVAATALTVDIGRLSARRRDMQAVADVIALDLVRSLGGRTVSAIVADPAWEQAITASRTRNGFGAAPGRSLPVRLGRYDDRSQVFTPSAPGEVPKAVEVTAVDSVDFAFAPGSQTTRRTAIASQSELAGFSIGSIGVSLTSQESILLDALIGDGLDVTGIAYSGLVGADVSLPLLLEELDLDLGNPEELLATNVALVELVRAQAEVLRRGGQLAQAQILDQLAVSLPNPQLPIAIGQLLEIETGGELSAATAAIDALQLLTATALVANGTNAIVIPGLALNLAGLTSTDIQLTVIEKPRFVFGPVGARTQTAQVSLLARVDAGGNILLGLASTSIVVGLSVANGEGVISAIGCGTPKRLDIGVRTSLVSTTVNVTGSVAVPIVGRVLDLDLGLATTRTAATGNVPFTLPPDLIGDAKRYDGGNGTGLSAPTLVRDDSRLLGIPLVPVSSLIASTLSLVVQPVLTALDQLISGPLNSLLGLSIADADVTPLAVTCTGPKLVG